MRHAYRRMTVTCLVLCGLAGAAHGADHFLTIGGGSSPANNQISLEKNILYFQRFLVDRGMGDLPQETFFADGTAGSRDLQYIDPHYQAPRSNVLLAEVFHCEHGLETQYRSHAIPGLSGPSTRKSIIQWFDTVGSRLNDGDRLFIYYTGHGARVPQSRATTLALWGENDMAVREFARLLDRLPPRVSVVLVMVQCYGGGFADVIFRDANPLLGLARGNRCGFFATLPNRIAAGCTAEADEENYHEYSTYFWAALYGRARSGEAVEAPDYDNDGRVSLAEAHAYALITSDTIDVSMKTSDAFLRQFSSTGGPTRADWLTAESAYEQLLDAAEPPEAAVLKALSRRLGLEGSSRVRAVRGMSEAIRHRRAGLEGERQKLATAHDQSCAALQSILRFRWPEMSNLLNPGVTRLLTDDAGEMVRLIERSAPYGELKREDQRMDAIDHELDELERQAAKCQRFLRAVEHVALAHNFPLIASTEIRARYQALVVAEGGTLTGTQTSKRPANDAAAAQ